jgi:copper transport protein
VSTRGFRRVAVLAALTVAIVLALASPAFAHATLLTTTPAPGTTYDASPPAVDLRFSEPVEVAIGDIRVFDGKAQRVVTGAPKHPGGDGNQVSVSLPELDDGTYVVTWRVISADTHPVEGAFTFQVGSTATVKNANGLAAQLLSDQSGSKAVSVAYGIDRFAVFAALALLIGSVVFLVVVFPRGVAIRRARRLVWVGWISVAVTTVLGVGLEGLYAAGLPLTKFFDAAVWGDTFDTRYGRVALLRLAIIAVALPFLVWWMRRDADARAPIWWLVVMGVAGIGLSLTPALAGHASTGRAVGFSIPADTVHVGAMACWLGGLVMLCAVVMPRKDPAELRAVLVRFSGLALGAVVLLVATGGFQAWRQIGTLDALKNTDYGQILIVKVVVFAALVIAAAFSREVVNRQFRFVDEEDDEGDDERVTPDRRPREPVAVGAVAAGNAATGDDGPPAGGRTGPGGAGANDTSGDDEGDEYDEYDDYEVPDLDTDLRRLRRSLWIEVVIATAVLAVTALLVNAAPARSVATEPVSMTLKNSKVWLDVTIAPGSAGRNDMHFTALAVGGGLTTIQDMQIQLTKDGADLPPFDVPLQQLGPGHYYSPLYDIPYPGAWHLIGRARLSETEETVLTGKFSLR